jgi:hypothetical protein
MVFASGSTPSGPMVKWMAQAYPERQLGLPPNLHAFLIAVESCCREVEERSEGIFPPESWNGFASGSTPSGPMDYTAHQIGLPPILHAFLIAVERRCRGVGERSLGFFPPEICGI